MSVQAEDLSSPRSVGSTVTPMDETTSSVKDHAGDDLYGHTDLSDILLYIALGHSLRGTASLLRLCSADIIQHSIVPAVRQGYWEARQAAGLVTPSQRKCMLSWPQTYCPPPLLSPIVRPTLKLKISSYRMDMNFEGAPIPTRAPCHLEIAYSTKRSRSNTFAEATMKLEDTDI
eukprot:768089-Hanusia_phi.AAC.2